MILALNLINILIRSSLQDDSFIANTAQKTLKGLSGAK